MAAKGFKTYRGYKFRMYPTEDEEALLRQHGGNARFLWNTLLAMNQEEHLANKKFIFRSEMSKRLPGMKREEFPFLALSHSQSLQQVCKNLDGALKDSFKGGKGFPRFKRKGQANDSFTIHQNFKITNARIHIPKIGWVKWAKHRQLQGKPKSITVSQDGDQWYVSVRCEIEVVLPEPTIKMIDGIEGIDLGLKDFLVSSTGEHIEHPKHLHKSEHKLKRAQRRFSRKKKGSNNRKKAKRRIQREHRKIRNQRKDFLHKTSHGLIKNHDGISVEDLNIRGMTKNHCLAKAVSSSGWGELMRQVAYKALWNGKHSVKVGMFYPSTQTCSGCDHPKTGDGRLKLKDRVYHCGECGLEKDRDENAAINIKREGQRILRERLAA